MTQLVIVGAGGFGRETIDVVDARIAHGDDALELLGVVDDAPSSVNLERLAARGVPYLGTSQEWLATAAPVRYAVGIGGPATRRSVVEAFDAAGHRGITLVHPAATVGPVVTVGDGTVVCAGVRITNNITVGRHVHLNLNVTVGHDCVLDDFVSVNPLVAVSGDCHVGEGVMIGTGAAVLQGLTLGDGSVVGASACVVRDVPAGVTVKGVPAR